MLPDYKAFAEYIAMNYPSARKIVEVGVGMEFAVVKELKRLLKDAEIIAVDIQGQDAVYEDLTALRPGLYRGADLIYALRPNPELYPYLVKIAIEVRADLIIRPFSLDPRPKKGELVNYKTTAFYVYKYLEKQ
ncbi:MAG: UPF0146 family protein [Candidatus Hydrothermarchaeota archaeon]|jgi:hypothetical protein|nr:UPF0146 family protein [Candidatus Hydrothermarchaeota archaeon]